MTTETMQATFADAYARHKDTATRLKAGTITADEVRESFAFFVENRPTFEAEFNGRTLKQLAPAGTGGRKKAEIIRSILSNMAGRYLPGDGIQWSPFEETFEGAIRRQVGELTDEEIKKHADKRAAEQAKQDKALTNPETADEFYRFMHERGELALTDEQLATFDAIRADFELKQRESEQERKAVVAAVEVGETEMKLIETTHTKKGIPLFVVQLSDRVSRETYDELNTAAKRLGGYYSSYRGGGAVPGFTFEDRAQAEKFLNIGDADQSRADLAEEREELVRGNAVDRLREMAATMRAEARDSQGRDRETNTARRVRMAESAEADARRKEAMADTMEALAAGIADGSVKYLREIRHRVQIETLSSLLSSASWRMVRETKGREDDRTTGPECVRFAEYPFPFVPVNSLRAVADSCMSRAGFKRCAARVAKLAETNAEFMKLTHETTIDDVRALARQLDSWTAYGVAERCDSFVRLRRAGIETLPHLRAALREFIALRREAREADPVKRMERALVGRDIPDFFPTPPDGIARMIDAAAIEPGMTCLEPEAGKGDIAEAIREAGGIVSACEVNYSLREILKAKGFEPIAFDFMDLQPGELFDRVVMNPPFSGQADIAHVRHAWKFLKPGGRLVAIMSAGSFFNSNGTASEFRDWLESIGGIVEELPGDLFNTRDSFRKTGVQTRLVTLNR